jgi:hypothetical protein
VSAQVRAIWVRGAGSYGRNDAGDAAVMSQALGAAVRVQYMRAEGTGWDPKPRQELGKRLGGELPNCDGTTLRLAMTVGMSSPMDLRVRLLVRT